MELADLVLVVGNGTVLETFPERWRAKIRVLNYAVDPSLLDSRYAVPVLPQFCYVATWCDLRKGFMDVLQSWSDPLATPTQLHVIGGLKQPWRDRMYEFAIDRLTYHGWLDSRSTAYRKLIGSCRYAHIPTYSEGQMGTLLDVMALGCIPVTTAISGVDEEVLDHCLVVQPRDLSGQRRAIAEAMSWSDHEYQQRRRALLEAVARNHSWSAFNAGVTEALNELT
jgi:glycosyltransferase involved in cell wall biosynthesis